MTSLMVAISSFAGPPRRLTWTRTAKRSMPLPQRAASACLKYAYSPGRPHLLQVIEGANFRPKRMDDHVARVDQHPVAMRQAFYPETGHAGALQLLAHMIRDRANMAMRPPGGHDHKVADRGLVA